MAQEDQLKKIAQQIVDTNKKVQIIYGFNSTGKTRLSQALIDLFAPNPKGGEKDGILWRKILYYNSFTEDLFYWDNNLLGDGEPKLKIHPNSFTDWILNDHVQVFKIINNFQRYTNDKLTPKFNVEYTRQDPDGKKTTVKEFSEVTFSMDTSGNHLADNFKISKGEESNFIWSIFYTLLEEVVSELSEKHENRITDQFNQLKYVFIDDPVSSLDENHLIELAVNLASLVKREKLGPKFVISTHNPLFYNVLHNEFKSLNKNWKQWQLVKIEDGKFELKVQPNDRPFSYHLFLKSELKSAIDNDQIKKYHFNLMRNILEKTSIFLGHKNWRDLLPRKSDGSVDPHITRIINLYSHSAHAGEEVAELNESDKQVLRSLFDHLTKIYLHNPIEGRQSG